jgi:hypothetical protein
MSTAVRPRVAAPQAGESLTTLSKRILAVLPDMQTKIRLLEDIYAAPSFERQIEIMGTKYVEFVKEGE